MTGDLDADVALQLRGTARVPDFVQAGRAEFVAGLSEWLRIRSISADPAHHGDVERSAHWLAAALRDVGFPTVEVWPTAGHPAVYAEWRSADADAPTVLVYGHSDVQPVDPIEAWRTPPFEPTLVEGPHGEQLVARGAADDKGQVYFHLLGVQAHLAATGRTTPAVHLRILIEGEEESGSPHFVGLLREHREQLSCDLVVVSDTGVWGRDAPSTVTGMRGVADAEVSFAGPATDIHSGSFGGAVPNPLVELCRLIGGLHDAAGRVAVPGFYDGVIELTQAERDLFARLPYDEQAWLRNARSTASSGEAGFTTLERVWARPTAEVNGISGGYAGPGFKNIVPAHATAKVSFRLVAGQEPRAILQSFEQWVHAQAPAGITARVELGAGAVRACLTQVDSPAVAAVRRAMQAAFEREVLITQEGGSGPEADLADELAAPVVFLGMSLPDDGWHGPNEKADVDMLLKGAESAAYLWSDLAATWPSPAAAGAASDEVVSP